MTQLKALVIDLREVDHKNKSTILDQLKLEDAEYLSFGENLTETRDDKIIDFDKIYKESYELAFNDLINYGSFKVNQHFTLADSLKDKSNKSLWFYFRFMLLYKYRKIVFEYKVLEKAKKIKNQYDVVYFIHHTKELERHIEASGIHSIYHRKANPSKKGKGALIFRFAILTSIRFFLGLFKIHRFYNASKMHLLLSDASFNQHVILMNSLDVVYGDHFTEYIQEYTEGQADFLNVSEFFPPQLGGANDLKLSGNYWKVKYSGMAFMEVLIYLQFLNPFFYFRARQNFSKIKRGFHQISKAETPSYLDYRFIGLVQSYKRMCYLICFRKAAFYYILKFFRFKSIVSANEHNARAKTIIEVAGQLGIKTYGIQHGVIHLRHLHYIFSEEDAKYKPFPDLTFVWGEYWEHVLQQHSIYKLGDTKVVGQLRTDIIPRLKKVNKKDLLQDLDDKKYTVLYPSQPLYAGEGNMRKKLCHDFLKLTIAFPEVQFLVKPHPFEKDYEAFFNQNAAEIGATNFKFINDDLYKILAYVDLVMIYNSTVGAEAIYFRKPLIVMNYSDNDFSGFLNEGVAEEANNFNELEECLSRFLKGENTINRDRLDAFIKARALKVDGNTCKRIVETVRNEA